MTDVIEIEALHKAYGDLPVLRDLTLRVKAGEVYGLLGPNGSGKTTLIHLMMGFLRPDRGRLRILGNADPERVRRRVGYIPERQRYHTHCTAREYLRFLGQLSGLSGGRLRERVERELAAVGLRSVADRRLSAYSKGMLQRLGIAQALLHEPDLLLIDEPTADLDPVDQHELLDLLGEVCERVHTVFLSTRFLPEAERLCERVGILAGGRIVVEAGMQDWQGVARRVRIRVGPLEAGVRASLEKIGNGVRCDAQSVLLSPNTPELQATVLRTLLDAGVAVIALEPLESPLERIYRDAISIPSLRSMMVASQESALEPPLAMSSPPDEPSSETDALLSELLGRSKTDSGPDGRQ